MNKIQWTALAILATPGMLSGQPARPAAKTAGEAYKNVQVFRDIPQTQMLSAMAVMSGALGVQCTYCHAQQFDSDEKPVKLTARKMIKMTLDINAANFGGKQVVSCNTCHQGGRHPNGVSPVWDGRTQQRLTAPPDAAPKSDQALPTVEEILEKYRTAVGVDHAKSLHLEGFLTTDTITRPRLIEFFAVFPDRASLTMTNAGVATTVLINADRAWVIAPQGVQDAPLDRVRGVATLFSPVKLTETDARREVAGEEQLDGRSCYRVVSTAADTTASLYFDKQTGLLYETRTQNRTPIGLESTRTILDDYADVAGIKLPFSITQAALTDRVVYRFSKIEANIDIDPKKFDAPAAKQ